MIIAPFSEKSSPLLTFFRKSCRMCLMTNGKEPLGRPKEYPPKVVREIERRLKLKVKPLEIAGSVIHGVEVKRAKVYEVRGNLIAKGELSAGRAS